DAVTDLVQSVQPVAVDAAGKTIEGLTVDPALVQVNVPVLPTATTRTVPVVPAVRGSVASGYWISRVIVDPAVVTVRGDASVLSAVTLPQVTASVDAAGKGPGAYPVDVTVRVPAGVTAQSVQPTRVMLTIRTRSG